MQALARGFEPAPSAARRIAANGPPPTAAKPDANKPDAEKTKPSDDETPKADAKPADAAAASSGAKPQAPDRQLQKAIDYLTGELAKAGERSSANLAK